MSATEPLRHLRASTANKRPTPAAMADGQLALNTNNTSPGLFFKDSNGALVKVGPVHVGTTAPNASPAVGGSTGNAIGEQWLDTAGGTYVFKVWDGSAWRSETGTFVDVNGDVMTGALGIIAGSAGSPGLYFSGDTNTGLYSPGADQVAISTGGSGRLFVDASGRVGVGTLNAGSSQTTLQVNTGGSASDGLGIYGNFTSQGAEQGAISFYGSAFANAALASVVCIDNRSSGSDSRTGSLTFKTSAGGTLSERLRITSAGLVGVGTSAPDELLTVASGTDRVGINVSGTVSTLLIGNRNPATSCSSISFDRGDGSLRFNNGVTGAITERARIDSSGRVGIGTSSPEDRLDLGSGYLRFKEAIGGTGTYGAIRAFNTLANTNPATSIRFIRDVANVGNDGAICFDTVNNERLRIDSSGRVGIGTASPAKQLHIEGTSSDVTLRIGRNGYVQTDLIGSTGAGANDFKITQNGFDRFVIEYGGNSAARIDSSGRLLVGTSSARGWSGITPQFQLEGLDVNSASASFTANINSANGSFLSFIKSRGTALNSNTLVSSGDILGALYFNGADGTGPVQAAVISAQVDGTPGANDMPGRLVFFVTRDGQASPTEATRIESTGRMQHTSSIDSLYLGSTQGAGTSYAFILGVHSRTGPQTGGTNAFLVYTNGNVQNTNNSYAGISDIKLKENIVDATSQWSDIKALQVRKYNFKEETGQQTHTQIGLVAQEVELVSPGLVTESPDRDAEGNDLGTVTKSVNYSVLYMKAVKALQEAMERIETLEASNTDLLVRVSALESA